MRRLHERGGGGPSPVRQVAYGGGRPVNEAAFEYYKRLSNVRTFVESHLSDHISLQQAAQVAEYQPAYFSAWFHKKVGIRFTEWLTLTRVSKAVQLIRTRDYAIWEVARAAGFGSLRTFERTFKRITNISPMRFKAVVRPS